MMQSRTQLALSDSAFGHLRQQIEKRSGLHFPEEKRYLLENRLGQRLKELALHSFDAYASYLGSLDGADGEWDVLLNLVTTRETYFFREVSQLKLITQELLPQVLQTKRQRGDTSLRLFSAACSSGDEAYTLAILLAETTGLPIGMRWEVAGMDISPQAISQAQAAIYGSYALRHLPEGLLQKYFQEVPGQGWQPVSLLRQRVSFRRGNLMDPLQVRASGSHDIILCRNVLIYFDAEARRSILANLAASLAPGGFLLTGFSETPKDGVPGLEIRRFGVHTVYQRAF